MTTRSLIVRLLSTEAQIDFSSLRKGFLPMSDYRKLQTAADRLTNANIWIDDSGALDILESTFDFLGLKVLGYREVPVDPSALGRSPGPEGFGAAQVVGWHDGELAAGADGRRGGTAVVVD